MFFTICKQYVCVVLIQDVVVDTPQGVPYQGKRCAASKICGVSILRAGETMEQAFRDVSKDTRIGKILIQTNRVTGEPEVVYKNSYIICNKQKKNKGNIIAIAYA